MSFVHTTALGQALAASRYEIVPMRGALEQARHLPAGSVVTVTCSPKKGVAATVELAEQINALGHTTVPHLAARRFVSHEHLEQVVARLTRAGINDFFVVGGDDVPDSDTVPGPFPRGVDLINALAEIKPDIRSVGIPCYPEGHAAIAADALDQALDEKYFFAGHMVTQMCFNPEAIRTWLERIRGRGIDLPVYIGIPGVIQRHKLLGIALRIGLGDSTRFLKKSGNVIGQLASAATYKPDALVDGVAELLEDPTLNVVGFHINSFNQIEKTEAWRQQRLAALEDLVATTESDGATSQAL